MTTYTVITYRAAEVHNYDSEDDYGSELCMWIGDDRDAAIENLGMYIDMHNQFRSWPRDEKTLDIVVLLDGKGQSPVGIESVIELEERRREVEEIAQYAQKYAQGQQELRERIEADRKATEQVRKKRDALESELAALRWQQTEYPSIDDRIAQILAELEKLK